jgi:hypothetical protein
VGKPTPTSCGAAGFGVGIRRLTKYKQGEDGESPAQGADQEEGGASLKKTELIEAIAERADVPKSQAQKYFDAFEEGRNRRAKGRR